jgi:prophage endopeptidase
MIALAKIPILWKVGAVIALVATLGAAHAYRVSAAYDAGHDAAVTERAAADLGAVLTRVQDNAVLGFRQQTINEILTKAKNEELAPVVQRIHADRVRVGTALCNGPSSSAETEGASGGDGVDSPGRLVHDDIERDLKALMVAVEQDLATGRACQAFIRENGFVP